MRGTYRGAVLVAVGVLLLIPLAGAEEHTVQGDMQWQIDELHVVPERTHGDGEAVVTAHVVDRNGDPVDPDRCETTNIIYDYAGETDIRMEYIENRMEQAGVPRDWFFDHLVVSSADNNMTVWARGRCDGIQPDTWTRDGVDFETDGELNVNWLSNVSDAYWEGDRMTQLWNVTWDAPGERQFVPYPNMSYTLYRPDMTVADSGRLIAIDKAFPGVIDIPRGSGLYILSVVAHNASLSDELGLDNPYGGIAKPVYVRPTYVEGHSLLHPSVERCREDPNTVCEKGASMDLAFVEERADADQVNVTVRSASGQNVYDEISLERWNESYWNGSFSVPEDFNTATFGHSLELEYTAYHWFERNQGPDQSTVTDYEYVDIEKFDMLESTPPFIRLGETIDIGFIPISPITEEPIPQEFFTEITVNVTDSEGKTVHRDTIYNPGQIYDSARNLFVYPYEVPYNATVGVHTADIAAKDNFSASSSVTSEFKVIGVNETTEPVVLMGAGGDWGNRKIEAEYDQPGRFKEKAILQNIGSNVNRVKVLFEGQIADIVSGVAAETQGDRTNITIGEESVHLSPQQQGLFEFTFDPEDSGEYTGNVVFDVTGEDISPYNITVPVHLSVDCKETFAVVYCVTATDLSASISDIGSYNLTIDVENMGEETKMFTTRVDGGLTTLVAGNTEWNEQVDPGNTTTVSIPYNVEQYDSGLYEGDIILSAHEGSAEFNASVDVEITEGEIDVQSDKSNLGDFVEGEDVTFSLTINNTGTVPVETVSASSSSLGLSQEDTVSLDPMEATTVNYTTSAPSGLRGAATVTVTAVDLGAEDSHGFTLRTFPDYSDDITEMQGWVSKKQDELERRAADIDDAVYENLKNDLRQIETNLENAQNDWEGENYESAERKFKDAEALRGTIETELPKAGSSDPGGSNTGDSENEGSGGFGLNSLLLPMVIILILFAIVGVILYLSVVPEKRKY